MFPISTVDPATASATLNNLSDATASVFPEGGLQVAMDSNDDGLGYTYQINDGLTPASYDFSNGISPVIDGMPPDYDQYLPSISWAVDANSSGNNPNGTPSSYYPGQFTGLLPSLLSIAAPKPVPQLTPSSAIVPRQQPSLLQSRLGGTQFTVGQMLIAALAFGAVIAVARA